MSNPADEFVDYRLIPLPCYVGPSDDGVDETAPGICGSWDPDSEVSVQNGVYHLDQVFVDDLISDPSVLIECDDARFDESASPPGFEVQDSDAGELLYALGLRDGDVLLSLNSLSLETYSDALDVFGLLYLTQGEDSFVLVVQRGSSTIMLDYSLQ